MNPINEIYKDKKLFRLKADAREELWNLCIDNSISTYDGEGYEQLREFLMIVITKAYVIGEMR